MQQKFDSEKHIKSKNKSGLIDTVLAGEKVVLETSVGELIPRYTMGDDSGRRKEAPVKFYKTGELKILPLEEALEVETSVGPIKSELVSFYKSGALWRAFPLNGKVTGIWTEENEYELAEIIEIPTSVGYIVAKPIYVQFYETGELESILFWPKEKVLVQSETLGEFQIHIGISFHKNGQVKGFEPLREITLDTPFGPLKAYDPDPNGMQAEILSVNFREDGSVESVITAANQIAVKKDGIEFKTFAPKLIPSYCNMSAFQVVPLKISFEKDAISFNCINDPVETLLDTFEYEVEEFVPDKKVVKFGC